MIQKMLAIYLWFLCLRACHSAGGCGRCAIARPRGATPRPRSGAAAESTSLWRRRNGRVEHPAFEVGGAAERRYPASEVRGGNERSYPASEVRGGDRRSYPMPLSPRPGVAARRSNPTPEFRGGGQEDQPHVQGAMAARAQEGLQELSHVEGQEGWQ